MPANRSLIATIASNPGSPIRFMGHAGHSLLHDYGASRELDHQLVTRHGNATGSHQGEDLRRTLQVGDRRPGARWVWTGGSASRRG